MATTMDEGQPAVERVALERTEIEQVEALLDGLGAHRCSVDEADFLLAAGLLAHDLPRRVRAALHRFRTDEPSSGACLLSGLPIDPARLPPTPPDWPAAKGAAAREDLLLVLLASLLGDVFGWTTQQAGHIVHDLVPVRAHDDEAVETGSRRHLMWHCDDAFHAYRADYLGLMCVRNPDRTPTTLGRIDTAALNEAHVRTLFEPRFLVRPDPSHLPQHAVAGGDAAGPGEFAHIHEQMARPIPVAVFHGDPVAPYVRLDPDAMSAAPGDEPAARALAALVAQIEGTLCDLALAPGDVLFVDNYRVVHGRRGFTARHDGSDRWLKRIGVTRDLRKSRAARATVTSRLIR